MSSLLREKRKRFSGNKIVVILKQLSEPRNMKAATVPKYGVREPLIVQDFPVPSHSADELLVRVKAASINPIDWKVMEGKVKILLNYRPPFVLGNDGSGVVTQVGANVRGFKVGDEVYFRPGKKRAGGAGTFAEYVAVVASDAAIKPSSITFEEAASLPLVGLTSWQALIDRANLQSGQKVLIHSGAGGVGTFAVQLARHKQAFIATTCSAANGDFVKNLGADQIVDYRKEKFDEVLKDFDVVFDTMGGDNALRSISVLKKGGVLVSVQGIPTPDVAKKYGRGALIQTLFSLLNRKLQGKARQSGVRYEYLFMDASGSQLEKIAGLVDSGIIRPIIDRVYPLEQIGEAFAYATLGHSRGKVVLRIS